MNVNIPDGELGDCKIETYTVSKKDAMFHNLREFINGTNRTIDAGTYKRLVIENKIVMSNTPSEINDMRYFIAIAKGNILISGLGLGILVSKLLQKQEIKSILVIEKNINVIKLVAKYFNDNRLKIIHADIFE